MTVFLKNKLAIFFSILTVLCVNTSSLANERPVSDHFNGSRFFNKAPDHGFWEMVKWMWEMETVKWPEWIEDPKQPPPVKSVGNGDLRVTFINHATVLIQMNGLNILTDPIWSVRAGPFSWAGVKRVRAPGVSMDDLPRIDYILISHDHYDHLDIPTLKQIVKKHQPKILAGLGVKTYLASHGFSDVVEMDWWQEFRPIASNNTFTFVPARHNSGRWPLMNNRTLWGGFVIDSPDGQVYYAGDTGFGDFVHDVGSRFSRIRLAILPIGSYEKRWFMKSQHLNPDDAVKIHTILDARQSLGVHYGTFSEHPEQTVDAHEKDLAHALQKYNTGPSRFWVLQFGEAKDVSAWHHEAKRTKIPKN